MILARKRAGRGGRGAGAEPDRLSHRPLKDDRRERQEEGLARPETPATAPRHEAFGADFEGNRPVLDLQSLYTVYFS